MGVPVKVCDSRQNPATGNTRSSCGANTIVITQVPNACSTVRVKQHKVGETVPIKIGEPCYVPTSGKSRTMVASNVNIVVQVPNNSGEIALVE